MLVDDLVRIMLVDNEPEAELAVSRLRLEGIPAIWQDTWLPPRGGGVKALASPNPIAILVDPENAERARELLS